MSFAQVAGNGGGRGGAGGRGAGSGRGGGRGNANAGHGQNPDTNQAAGQGNQSNSQEAQDSTDNNNRNTPGQYLDRAIDIRQAEMTFATSDPTDTKSALSRWLAMDSGSTADIICNEELLSDVRREERPLPVRCNAGIMWLTETGRLGNYPNRVWLHKDGVANILGLKNVKEHFRVTYDSEEEDPFIVHHPDGCNSKFRASSTGLYLLDVHEGSDAEREWCLLVTVDERKAEYKIRGLRQAEIARRAQDIMMRPSTRDYMTYISNNTIRNCPVERAHIAAAERIYGPNLGSLKGKTVRRNVKPVHTSKDPVPEEIMSKYHDVTLATDIMFVNKIPFLISVSLGGLKFGIVTRLDNRQIPTVAKELKKMIHVYEQRGFKVTSMLADSEFEPLEEIFSFLECCGKDDHQPDIERYIRTVKDRVRSAYNVLPFKHIPKILIERLIGNAVFWLNALPPGEGASATISPRHIITGHPIDYEKHVQIPFGAYVQSHESTSNDMRERALGCVCAGPTGNSQGTHWFVSLTTGRLVRRTNWTELPMPDYVINRISDLGRRQKMPRTLTFADRHGTELFNDNVDDDHDSLYNPDSDSESDDDSTFAYDSDESDLSDDEPTVDEDEVTTTDARPRRRAGVIEPTSQAPQRAQNQASNVEPNDHEEGEDNTDDEDGPNNSRNGDDSIVDDNNEADETNDTHNANVIQIESDESSPAVEPLLENESNESNVSEEHTRTTSGASDIQNAEAPQHDHDVTDDHEAATAAPVANTKGKEAIQKIKKAKEGLSMEEHTKDTMEVFLGQ